jgi:hypothetical protein
MRLHLLEWWRPSEIDGINTRMRRLLGAEAVPARRFHARAVPELDVDSPALLYRTPSPPEVFQPETGWPFHRRLERWMAGEGES